MFFYTKKMTFVHSKLLNIASHFNKKFYLQYLKLVLIQFVTGQS